MKRRKTLELGSFIFSFAAAFLACPCSAQQTLNWYKVSGGGGNSSSISSGARFSISAPLASPMPTSS